MSLQIWLPLNGNLYNQGLYNTNIISNNNIQINNNGKIGSCYYFNGTADYIKGTYYATDTMSFCLWVKFIGESTVKNGHLLDCRNQNGSIGYQPMYIHATQGIQVGGTGSSFPYIPYIFQVDTWYHIGVIYSPSDTKLYINGKLEGRNTTSKGVNYNQELQFMLGSRCNNTTWQNVCINDFRIYDHCLSNKEIEEISKGLVLHYKLDNVINNVIYDCSGYNHNGSVIGPFTFHNVSSRYGKSITMNNTNTANQIECNDVINLPIDGITVSFWAYTEKINNYVLYIDQNMSFAVNSSGGSFYVSRVSSAGFPMTEFKANQWNHVVLIRNGDTYKAYINGKNIPRSQSNNYWYHQVPNIYLLNRKYNNNYATDASISDFRMYATELTESQIQELYYTSAAIDKNGNIYSREMVEE